MKLEVTLIVNIYTRKSFIANKKNTTEQIPECLKAAGKYPESVTLLLREPVPGGALSLLADVEGVAVVVQEAGNQNRSLALPLNRLLNEVTPDAQCAQGGN